MSEQTDKKVSEHLHEYELNVIYSELIESVSTKILEQTPDKPFTNESLDKALKKLKVSNDKSRMRLNTHFLEQAITNLHKDGELKEINNLDDLARAFKLMDAKAFKDIDSVIAAEKKNKYNQYEATVKELLQYEDPELVSKNVDQLFSKFGRLGHHLDFDHENGTYKLTSHDSKKTVSAEDFEADTLEEGAQSTNAEENHDGDENASKADSANTDPSNKDKNTKEQEKRDTKQDKDILKAAANAKAAQELASNQAQMNPTIVTDSLGLGKAVEELVKAPVTLGASLATGIGALGKKAFTVGKEVFAKTKNNAISTPEEQQAIENKVVDNAASNIAQELKDSTESIKSDIESIATKQDKDGNPLTDEQVNSLKEKVESDMNGLDEKMQDAAKCLESEATTDEAREELKQSLEDVKSIDEKMEEHNENEDVSELQKKFQEVLKKILAAIKSLFGKREKQAEADADFSM